jgi:hypothetical protein
MQIEIQAMERRVAFIRRTAHCAEKNRLTSILVPDTCGGQSVNWRSQCAAIWRSQRFAKYFPFDFNHLQKNRGCVAQAAE